MNRICLGTAAIALTGCTLLAPVRDESRFFLLTPITPGTGGAAVKQANTETLILGLGPIKFPDYLRRNDIVTRVESNRVQFSDNNHWAEPLKANFTSVLSQDLSELLGTQQIVNFPWYSSTKIDYQIPITVIRFECGAQGSGQLAATWTINDPSGGRVLHRGEADLKAECGATVDQGVAGLSQALGDFSRQIATAMAQVRSIRRPR